MDGGSGWGGAWFPPMPLRAPPLLGTMMDGGPGGWGLPCPPLLLGAIIMDGVPSPASPLSPF